MSRFFFYTNWKLVAFSLENKNQFKNLFSLISR
jgi:hypothetical protein